MGLSAAADSTVSLDGQSRTSHLHHRLGDQVDRGGGLLAASEQLFGDVSKGLFVGEMSLDGRPRSASVMALEPPTCSSYE